VAATITMLVNAVTRAGKSHNARTSSKIYHTPPFIINDY